jgi:hypothetical protein
MAVARTLRFELFPDGSTVVREILPFLDMEDITLILAAITPCLQLDIELTRCLIIQKKKPP